MAQHYGFCAYSAVPAHIVGAPALLDGGIWTGHHIIPDHCFYFTSGLRGRGDLTAFLQPGCAGYRTDDAPTIVVDADSNGGKSRTHGAIHDIFDKLESKAAKGKTWTYHEALEAAIDSINTVLGAVAAGQAEMQMAAYFETQLGISKNAKLRAGERTALPNPTPRTTRNSTS
jgi:hypothetical protein